MRHSVVLTSILLLIAAQDLGMLGFDRITAQEAADRFGKCGLGPVTIRWNDPDTGGEDILVATEVTSATDDQLRCAEKAISYYTVELPSEIQNRYQALRAERLAPVLQARARSWLSARNLLSRLPKYQKGATNDAAFTRQIERLCGRTATGAFQSRFGFHALSPEWAKRGLTSNEGRDTFACLMNAATAAGFDFGFIGNEQDGR